ncbi:hypothetical protein PR202_ga27853 [Eleusine coracana subsp. coracana]|uniref:Uncharacterized protein n=1 Tax=Eleusine coracana subsp. coracana TaxID=191504 RepID=A0AAV5DH17_ELECO|nr:hypothetical protein PR202_ga27853 [Eleusine coracana subsp. coracana]
MALTLLGRPRRPRLRPRGGRNQHPRPPVARSLESTPELSFREITPDALDAALAQVARRELSLLHIDVSTEHVCSAARLASLLAAAARLAPVVLTLKVWGDVNDQLIDIEVPLFHRATSIKLVAWNLKLTPPAQSGEYPVLQSLSVSGCLFDTSGMIRRCPRLRVLELCSYKGLGKIVVHSETIETLVVDATGWVHGIDTVAPALNKFTLDASMEKEFSVSFSAPMMQNLWWSCLCPSECRGW